MTRRVTPSVFPITTFGEDVQRQHAARLLLSGYDIESAARLSGLPLDEVTALAATVDFRELEPPP
jgi:hypothetical protein